MVLVSAVSSCVSSWFMVVVGSRLEMGSSLVFILNIFKLNTANRVENCFVPRKKEDWSVVTLPFWMSSRITAAAQVVRCNPFK